MWAYYKLALSAYRVDFRMEMIKQILNCWNNIKQKSEIHFIQNPHVDLVRFRLRLHLCVYKRVRMHIHEQNHLSVFFMSVFLNFNLIYFSS